MKCDCNEAYRAFSPSQKTLLLLYTTRMNDRSSLLNRVQLRDDLIRAFSESEFTHFVEQLDIQYSSLRGENLRDRATVLIGKMERTHRLSELIDALVAGRPNLQSRYAAYLGVEIQPEPTEEERLDWLHKMELPNEEPPTMKWDSEIN